jgi:Serine dehydrogenase proteinase
MTEEIPAPNAEGAQALPVPAAPEPPDGNGTPFSGNSLGSSRPSPKSAAPKKYFASIYPGESETVSAEFAELVLRLELELKMPIWLLVQNGKGAWSEISTVIYRAFRADSHEIQREQPVALLVDSPGGDAHQAFRIARIFQRRSSAFTVLVPQFAKSAATLMALGATKLIMCEDAELGPLDVQLLDFEREDFGSALDAVQSLERLNAFALTAVDQTMQLLMVRTRKRADTILPHVLTYVTEFVRPLLEKIDTV